MAEAISLRAARFSEMSRSKSLFAEVREWESRNRKQGMRKRHLISTVLRAGDTGVVCRCPRRFLEAEEWWCEYIRRLIKWDVEERTGCCR